MALISAWSKQSASSRPKRSRTWRANPPVRFKVLVMPADLPKRSAEQEAARLHAFTAGGGVIIRAGKVVAGIAARAEDAAEGLSPQFGAPRSTCWASRRKPTVRL